MPSSTVTVLGLGPMGRALAGAFLAAGARTTVWNRTPGRDRELVERGAVGARSAAEAVAASPLTVVCVVDYDAADALLRSEARAEGVSARELAPFAQGIAAILPPLFEETAGEADEGRFAGGGNPLTSAVSSMAHIVQAAEAHGIDSGVMRAAEGMARRAVGLGHGADGFVRIADVLAAPLARSAG
ncbi:hypothetical protein C6N75_18085 [Streptomyces solincola]|uniref:NAD(P)-dependent oxidoreductase n=1 Tax=Streptomyces solincola TaxID=2100817 RepID=A0A2S9PU37_9ACTN|nr:NAD(P)-binding domain-containing protein [Streptomyces solincola]PRH77847.1 hypothetical protein C6N75_18085 [Streptomyces solincola]